MTPKDRHFLEQNDSWQKGLFWTKVSLGVNFLAKYPPWARVFWGKRSLGNRLRGVQNKHEKCKKNVNIIFYFLQIFTDF